jgi:rhodanese-related sulfurtransferase
MQKNMLRNGFLAIAMAVGLSGALASCGSSNEGGQQTEKAAAGARAEDVDVAAFAALIESLDNPILLDVRSDGEWAEGHLPQASYIPFQAPDFADQLAALDKSRPVLVYCAAGGRSSKAMNILNQSGQTEVYNLLGGIRAWSAAGQPVVNGEPQPIQ